MKGFLIGLSWFLSLYPMAGTITEIRPESDTFIITESNGNQWEYAGIEDYMVGDLVACIMNDMGTEEIEDDIIVRCRYCG